MCIRSQLTMSALAAIVAACLVLAAAPCRADNNVNWATTASYQIFDQPGTTPLTPGGDGVGYLVQLIYAGGNGIPDAVSVTDNPGDDDGYWTTSGDDVFAAYSWIGFGYPPAMQPGRFDMVSGNSYLNTRANGSVYFIRAWQYAADAPGTGERITFEGDWYGDSQIFSISGNPLGGPYTVDNFYLTSNFNTATPVVPEPGTMFLMGIGLAAAGLARRKKRA